MTTFTFNSSIPATNDDPADDQPVMQTNNASISGIIAVDHVGFNVANGGYHKQITFNDNNVPSSPSGNLSVLYTNVGTASSSPQLYWVNANTTLPVSPFKAFATYTISGGVLTQVQASNVTSVTRSSAGVYAVVLAAGSVTGSSFGVVASVNNSSVTTDNLSINYIITGAATFTLKVRVGVTLFDSDGFTFSVIQV